MNQYRLLLFVLLLSISPNLFGMQLLSNIAHFFKCKTTDTGSKRMAIVGVDGDMLLVDYFYKKPGCNDDDFTGKVNSREGKVNVISKNNKTGELEIEVISRKKFKLVTDHLDKILKN